MSIRFWPSERKKEFYLVFCELKKRINEIGYKKNFSNIYEWILKLLISFIVYSKTGLDLIKNV